MEVDFNRKNLKENSYIDYPYISSPKNRSIFSHSPPPYAVLELPELQHPHEHSIDLTGSVL